MVVADVALDSRVVMVLGLTGDEPFAVDDLEPYLVAASARLPVFAAELERCCAAGPPRGRCLGLGDW